MGFFKRLFSAPETVASTVKSAISGLDDIVYTEQERAEKTQQAQKVYQAMWMAAVPSAISRRIITVQVTGMWSLIILAMLVSKAIGADAFAAYTLTLMVDIVLTPFNIILGFYFLSQVVSKYTNGSPKS